MKNKTPQKERAAAPTTAQKYDLQVKPYQKTSQASSLKLQIGELLLFGNKECWEFWGVFEVLLRQYIDIRISQGGFQGCSACVESANVGKKVSG